jgi:hypothetical protein
MAKIASICAGLLLLLAIGSLSPAPAQTAANSAASPPDKSDYTLFDPTPDDQMRRFCTDRPPQANLPCTVDAGHFQYESDIINFTNSTTGGVTENTWLFTNPTVKLGLTNRIDLELNMAPDETVTTRSAAGKQSLTGVGDLFVRTKVNLGRRGGRRLPGRDHSLCEDPDRPARDRQRRG